jgi:hypothetical protein
VSRRSKIAVLLVALSPSLFGCGAASKPVADALWRAIVFVGRKAGETVAARAIEGLFDRVFGGSKDSANAVEVDPNNPLRGRCAGPVRIQNANDKSKELVLIDFPVVRQTTSSQWTVDPSYQSRIESVVK